MNVSTRKCRRSIRLKGYDYAQEGAYFVTLVAHQRECLFGEVVHGILQPNVFGRIVAEEWQRSAEIRDEIELDEFIVMPNHLHAVVFIVGDSGLISPHETECVGATGRSPLRAANGPKPHSLSALVAGFKSAATKRINVARNNPGAPVWQRNYYEHIVRDENDLRRAREYIQNNPQTWEQDAENNGAVR